MCAQGKYQDEHRSTSCKNCGPGRYQPLSLGVCASGYYPWKSYKKIGFTCASIPIGTFGPAWASFVVSTATAMVACAEKCSSLKDCLYYTFFSDKTCRLYANCEEEVTVSWRRSVTCRQSRDACYDCPVGRYSNVVIPTEECIRCSPGTYMNEYGETSCQMCVAGKYDRHFVPIQIIGPVSVGSLPHTFPSITANTYSATIGYQTLEFRMCSGVTVMFSSCSGLSVGDTYLRLYETNGTQVAANDDDHFCTISGLLSFISYTKNTIGCASFTLHLGCYGYSLCTNHLVMEYTKDSPSKLLDTARGSYLPYTTLPLVSESQYDILHLKICDGVTAEFSTCNSITTGDTTMALYNSSGMLVAWNNDDSSCSWTTKSTLQFTRTSTGCEDYVLNLTCSQAGSTSYVACRHHVELTNLVQPELESNSHFRIEERTTCTQCPHFQYNNAPGQTSCDVVPKPIAQSYTFSIDENSPVIFPESISCLHEWSFIYVIDDDSNYTVKAFWKCFVGHSLYKHRYTWCSSEINDIL